MSKQLGSTIPKQRLGLSSTFVLEWPKKREARAKIPSLTFCNLTCSGFASVFSQRLPALYSENSENFVPRHFSSALLGEIERSTRGRHTCTHSRLCGNVTYDRGSKSSPKPILLSSARISDTFVWFNLGHMHVQVVKSGECSTPVGKVIP